MTDMKKLNQNHLNLLINITKFTVITEIIEKDNFFKPMVVQVLKVIHLIKKKMVLQNKNQIYFVLSKYLNKSVLLRLVVDSGEELVFEY